MLQTETDFDSIQRGLKITEAGQSANITVAEKGTIAAAVTQINARAVSGAAADQVIRFDRPFHYEIVHVETGLPLFMGRVSDPTPIMRRSFRFCRSITGRLPTRGGGGERPERERVASAGRPARARRTGAGGHPVPDPRRDEVLGRPGRLQRRGALGQFRGDGCGQRAAGAGHGHLAHLWGRRALRGSRRRRRRRRRPAPARRTPPLARTAAPLISWMRMAAALSDSTSVISRPESDSASKWLGVTKVASGRICAFSAWSVSRAWPGSWPLQISTGSSTTLPERVGLQRAGNRGDGRRAAQHADLHGVQHGRRARRGTVRRRRRLQLVGDHLLVHRDEAVVPVVLRIEGDNAGQVGDAEDAEFLEGLQVRLRAGAAGGFGPGDGQDDCGGGAGVQSAETEVMAPSCHPASCRCRLCF